MMMYGNGIEIFVSDIVNGMWKTMVSGNRGYYLTLFFVLFKTIPSPMLQKVMLCFLSSLCCNIKYRWAYTLHPYV